MSISPVALALLIVLLMGVAVAIAYGRWHARTLTRERTSGIQAALHKAEASEARMRAVLDHAAEAIITIDSKGAIQSFNPAAERIFGYTANEAIGANVSMLMQPPDRERHDDYIARYLATGEGRIIGVGREVAGRRNDGSPIALELAVTELGIAGERVFCGIAHDITARKEAEAATRVNEQKLRSYIDLSLDGVLVVDGAGRYLEANPAACAMLGYEERELLTLDIRSTLYPDDAKLREGAAHFERVVGSGSSKGEVWLQRKDGTRIIADINAVALGNGRYLGLLRDVTERRLAERELEQERALLETRVAERTETLTQTNATLQQEVSERKRMEAELVEARERALQAAEEKARFLANMSHEIRTPMNAMIGAAVLLRDAPLDHELRSLVDTICTGGEMLLATVQDVLDLSKIESGNLELESRPLEVGHSVEEAFDVVAPGAAEKGLDLCYELDADVPGWIVGDETRLRQILVNLLSNAVKFTERGEVCVSVRCGEGSGGEPMLQFTVRDTGIGIPAAKMGHLFKAFSQTDPSMARRFGGTGLGLAICARLAAMAGGQIWATSEEGRGSKFHFTLPARAVPSGAATRYPREPLGALVGKRVLIAMDSATGLRTLGEACRRWGFEVATARTGPEAIDALGGGAPLDAVVIDAGAPELDGRELVRVARSGGRVPTLVALVSRARARDGVAARVDGIALALPKPVKHTQLLGVLGQASGVATSLPATPDARYQLDGSLARRIPLAILVAEDSPINQSLIVRILAKLGYACDVAANGQEALDRIAGRHYDLVLMDMQMPVMDGFEAARRIVDEWPPGMRPCLIAMTANALPGDREKCLAAGMDDYLPKPVLPATLQRALERLGARRSVEAVPDIDSPVVDARTIEALRALDDPGKPSFVRGLIGDYLDGGRRQIDELWRSAAAGDAPTLAAAAHRFAGISSSVGAVAVARISIRIEKHAAAGALSEAQRLLGELGPAFEETRAKLAGRL